MTREEFIKQRCEIDKITEEEFEKRYRVVKCNCGQPYCKGYRCLDLDGLLKENQELKEDISFCLHSIKQEMKMSTDSRTRNEMTSCYDILMRWNNARNLERCSWI